MAKKLKGFLVAIPESEIAGLEATMVPEASSVLVTPLSENAGLEATMVPELSSVFTTPLETAEVTGAVPETMSFPVDRDETPITLAEAA